MDGEKETRDLQKRQVSVAVNRLKDLLFPLGECGWSACHLRAPFADYQLLVIGIHCPGVVIECLWRRVTTGEGKTLSGKRFPPPETHSMTSGAIFFVASQSHPCGSSSGSG